MTEGRKKQEKWHYHKGKVGEWDDDEDDEEEEEEAQQMFLVNLTSF